MPDRRHIGNLGVDMLHRRPTCLIGDPSETDMPHRRPTYLLSLIGISTHLNILFFIYFLLNYICILEQYIGACRLQMSIRLSMWMSLMGLRSGMSVSDGSPLGLRWFSHFTIIFVISLNKYKECQKTWDNPFFLLIEGPFFLFILYDKIPKVVFQVSWFLDSLYDSSLP